MINPFQYEGTSGAVARQTSIDREAYERDAGETKARAIRVMVILNDYGAEGRTWKELQVVYEARYKVQLHHGQISGLLSNLHKDGQVFTSPLVKRKNCFAYIDCRFKDQYEDGNRFDNPVQTKAGIRRAALEELLADIRQLADKQEQYSYDEFTAELDMALWAFGRKTLP
jgi:hypothetical protein